MNRKIGIVCEGKTDFYVIDAALNAIISNDFILTRLHPEDTPRSNKLGEGWWGVFKWCRDTLSHENIEAKVLRITYDIIIIDAPDRSIHSNSLLQWLKSDRA